MHKTGVFHHLGTFLLFVSAILLLITTISAPVIGDIGILKVMLTNKTDIRNSSVCSALLATAFSMSLPSSTSLGLQ